MTNVLPLYRRALGDTWRSLIGWSLGVVAAIFLYVPLFPSIGGSPDVQALLDSMPPEMIKALGYDSLGTGAGYVHSTFYGLIGFVLIYLAIKHDMEPALLLPMGFGAVLVNLPFVNTEAIETLFNAGIFNFI